MEEEIPVSIVKIHYMLQELRLIFHSAKQSEEHQKYTMGREIQTRESQ